MVVPNSMCPQPPPPDRQYCNVLDCPVRWQTGDWSKCSKTCGGGVKQRDVSVVEGRFRIKEARAQCPSHGVSCT